MGDVHRVCRIRITPTSDRGPLVTVGGEATMTDAWWESPAVLTAVQDGDAGTVIRLARRAKGATQRQTGDACGYSQSEISRIENGRARVHDIRTLERLAGHLDIPPQLLGLAPLDIDPDWSVRRRDFLRGAASGAATAMLTANGRGSRGCPICSRSPDRRHTIRPRWLGSRSASPRHTRSISEASTSMSPTDSPRSSAPRPTARSSPRTSEAGSACSRRRDGPSCWPPSSRPSSTTRRPPASPPTGRSRRGPSARLAVLQGAATYQLACALEAGGERAHAEQVAAIGADHLAAGATETPP